MVPPSIIWSQDCTADDSTEGVELWGECYSIENTISLDLSYGGLTGEIPPEIGNLINLISLILKENQLNGDIPTEITYLTNLTNLDLGGNQLNGAIPFEIGYLTNLTILDLGGNQLMGEIPTEIGNLTNLTDLELGGNHLTGEIPSEIDNLVNLTFLHLEYNQLTGEIPPEIGNLINLIWLNLVNNLLTGEIPSSICNLDMNWSNPDNFNIYDNQLCPPYPSCVEDYVGEQDTTNCSFCDEGYTDILDIPESVTVLDNSNCFYQSDLDVLQEFINNSQEGNNPPPSYLLPIELGEQVWGNGRLTEFKCSTLWPTYLDYELSGDIPDGLSSLSELIDLFLNANQLTSIPNDIGNLTNLNLLELGGNQITSIPGSIGNLNNLEWFYIYNNQLTYLPEQICYILANLSSFSIEYNLLCPGTYPECVEDYLSIQDTSNCFEICEEFAINNIQMMPNTEWGNMLFFYIDIPDVELYAPYFILQTDDEYLSIIDPVYSFFYITGPAYVDLLYHYEYEYIPNNHLFSGNIHMFTEDGVLTCNLPFNETINNVITVDYSQSWNLTSLPLQTNEYPCISMDESTLYSFGNEGYVSVPIDVMEIGTGYWLRFEEAETCAFSGQFITEATITLSDDWNLIGSISSPVDVNTIIDEYNLIVPGTVYGFYDGYFVAETIEPGYGYWMRSTGDGEITLTLGVSARVAPREDYSLKDKANTLSINGSELYFGVELSDRERLTYSLPPKPPAGAFDVRFKDGWRHVEDYGEIEVMKTTETLTIDYNIMVNAGEHMNWVLTSDNGKDYTLEGSGEVTIPSSERFLLNREPVVPITFSLHQNYPNPFNPITTLRYDLPSDALVTLSIYDMLGREIVQLVSTNQKAGFKSVQWNAKDSVGRPVSAGVYLYQIRAGKFVETKKMVLLK